MNSPQPSANKPDIPEEMRVKWQRIVDLMTRAFGVPAGFIVKADSTDMEIFVASATKENPYRAGTRLPLNSSLYCEKVIKARSPLLIPDASKNRELAQGQQVAEGITYYLGYPIIWPDEEVFGTICIVDAKENKQATELKELLSEFRELIERDLCVLVESDTREGLLIELQRQRTDLEKIIASRTAALEESREILEERVKFEQLISDLSADLVSAAPDEMDDLIGSILTKICRLFGADHCAFMEVPADRGPAHFVNMKDKEERRQKGLPLDVITGHPWARQKLVEEGTPIIFSSLDELPLEASVDRAAWELEGTQAVLTLPLRVGGRVTHLIGLRSFSCGYQWPEIHIRRLRVLGETIANSLIKLQMHDYLVKSEQSLAEAQSIAHLGSWEWDITSGRLRWSDEVYRIFGLHPQEFEATYEAFLSRVDPDDREAVRQAVDASLADPQKLYGIEHRVLRSDCTDRIVHEQGRVFFDQDQRPLRMIGTVLDITERKRAQAELEKALEQIGKLKEQLEAENLYLKEEVEYISGFSNIVGASNAIKYVMYRIQQVAASRTTVLLTGETGTGKGMFARALHEASDRRHKPFVHVNCAGLPANLIESELFGREKGAFTGSTGRQIGRFELANGGTIFLDEIGELPLDLQTKLLKVIEDGTFERLGSPHSVKVDVRIIGSTNRNLDEEVKKGEFRKDLFYRLNVFPITIPPLKQRRGDIPLLVNFFADEFSKRHGKNIKKIPAKTMNALENYDWPGNVRELMNIVERAVIVSEGPELRLAEKIDEVRTIHPHRAGEEEEKRSSRSLSAMEREHILKSLQETGWRIEGPSGAARLLGINPSTLRARMEKLKIRRPSVPKGSR